MAVQWKLFVEMNLSAAEVQVMRKIEKCGKDLTQWSRQHFVSVRRELKKKKKQLEKAELVAMQSGNNFRVRELTKEVHDLMDKENKMWRQHAKIIGVW